MRRNGGMPSEQPTSGVAPSPETIFANGRILDSRTPNLPHVHSSASSLDLIAISEDEIELVRVISQLIQYQALLDHLRDTLNQKLIFLLSPT